MTRFLFHSLPLNCLLVCLFSISSFAQDALDELFEDHVAPSVDTAGGFFTSPAVDFIQIASSITDDVTFAIVVWKPAQPAPVLLLSHGWHQSVRVPQAGDQNPYPGFLTIQVDMRGRQYSTGTPDANGYELYDFYDAYRYATAHYPDHISDTTTVYYLGGSGGGGNGYGLVGKFPDLFTSAVILAGMSDYAEWYRQDSIEGEFRDELLPWIGTTPEANLTAYASRSGITTVSNLLAPLYIIHGETDVRVPSSHARRYVAKAQQYHKQTNYLELDRVGTRSHWGRITPEQEAQKQAWIHRGLHDHQRPPALPERGTLVVAGYVVTHCFSVFLDSVDEVGKVTYDLRKKKASLSGASGKVVWHATSP